MESWVTEVIRSMGYVGVALLMLLENLVPPIPSEVVMPLAGYVAARGGMSLWVVIAVGSAGSLAGSLIWYLVARAIGKARLRRWVERHGHWLTIDLASLDRATALFERHSAVAVTIGRLVPGVRVLVSLPAGFAAMGIGRFLLYSSFGTVLWTGALTYLGHHLGRNYAIIGEYLGPVSWAVIGGLIVLYFVRVFRMRAHAHAR